MHRLLLSCKLSLLLKVFLRCLKRPNFRRATTYSSCSGKSLAKSLICTASIHVVTWRSHALLPGLRAHTPTHNLTDTLARHSFRVHVKLEFPPRMQEEKSGEGPIPVVRDLSFYFQSSGPWMRAIRPPVDLVLILKVSARPVSGILDASLGCSRKE